MKYKPVMVMITSRVTSFCIYSTPFAIVIFFSSLSLVLAPSLSFLLSVSYSLSVICRFSIVTKLSVFVSLVMDMNNFDSIISWTDLSVSINGEFNVRRLLYGKKKIILQPQSGTINHGSLIALMGPSGSGKTTLLNTLSGKQRGNGVTGSIKYQSGIRISYVPQADTLIGALTARETMDYAYSFKLIDTKRYHEKDSYVEKIIRDFNLSDCADTVIDSCSGGQVKRISVAYGLITAPDIVMFDEPTSGLDSVNAESLISVLRLYAKNNPNVSIICSIHQPSFDILQKFTHVYALSRNGHKIIDCKPMEISGFLESTSFKCPSSSNPADYLLKYSIKYNHSDIPIISSYEKIAYPSTNKDDFNLSHVLIHLKRNIRIITANPMNMILHILALLITPFCWMFLFKDSVGQTDGCWSDMIGYDFSRGQNESIMSMVNRFSSNENGQGSFTDRIADVQANLSIMLITVFFIIFVHCLLSTIEMQSYMGVLLLETKNNMYSSASYFIGRTLCNTPITTVFIAIFVILSYVVNHQILEWWRCGMFVTICILVGLIAESTGLIVGAVFHSNITSACLVSVLQLIMNLINGGFFIRISDTRAVGIVFVYLSYVRYSIEGLLVTIYGFGRCKSDNFIDINQQPLDIVSSVLSGLNIRNRDLELISAYFGIEQNCMESVWNSTVDYIGVYGAETIDPDYYNIEPTMDDSSDGGYDSNSYPMSYFSLEESYLFRSIICLFSLLIFYKILAYFAIRTVLNRN